MEIKSEKKVIHNATALFSHNPFTAYPHLDIILTWLNRYRERAANAC